MKTFGNAVISITQKVAQKCLDFASILSSPQQHQCRDITTRVIVTTLAISANAAWFTYFSMYYSIISFIGLNLYQGDKLPASGMELCLFIIAPVLATALAAISCENFTIGTFKFISQCMVRPRQFLDPDRESAEDRHQRVVEENERTWLEAEENGGLIQRRARLAPQDESDLWV
jgi:hypothetical protein